MWYFASIPLVPENRAWFTAVFVFACLACTFVLMRLVSRGFLSRTLGADDFLMFLAMVLSIGWLISVVEQIRRGLGDTIRIGQLEDFLFWLWWTIIFYTWCQWVIKLSILAQYFRLFESERAKKMLRLILAWFITYGIVNCITPIFMCVPVQKYWKPATTGYCTNFYALHYVLATFNVINDLILLIFPIPMLIKLHLPLRIRIILVLTFTCGVFATIVSMMRFYAMAINASGALDKEPILGVQTVIWSGLEMNIAIVCGSVPAVKPLFTLIFPSLDFKVRTSSRPQRIQTAEPRPKSSAAAKLSSAKALNPLNTLRKYGQGMSILNVTVSSHNELELEQRGNCATGKHSVVERSVQQTWAPALEVDNSSLRRLMSWDMECGGRLPETLAC